MTKGLMCVFGVLLSLLLWAAGLVASAQQEAAPSPFPERKSSESRLSGTTFRDALRDGGEGPEMTVIAAGKFTMGSDELEEGRNDNEGPLHEVTIRAFAMGTTELTFADYDLCTAAAVSAEADDEGWGRGLRPVINISWNDAQRYATWLSQQTGKRYRLPSEAEWEYAARGGTSTTYWWGMEIDGDHTHCGDCDGSGKTEQTLPVKSLPPNGFGLFEVSGNVWEWVQDCYQDSYVGAPTDGRAAEGKSCDWRVYRSGSWNAVSDWLRVANRHSFQEREFSNSLGFRLAVDI